VLEIDPERRLARVEPGCNLDLLRREAASHGLTFGPDPATHDRNTLGGMVGNDSCGVHSVLAEFYGPGPRTSDSVRELEVLTYGGLRLRVGETPAAALPDEIRRPGPRGALYRRLAGLRDRYEGEIRARFPQIPRRVSGYALDRLLPEHGFHVARALVGTEGTCVVVLEAVLDLIPTRDARVLVALGYPDVFRAADHVMLVREHRPVGLEGIDDQLVEFMRRKGIHPRDIDLLPPGGGWLLAEFGADSLREAREQADRCVEALRRRDDAPSVKVFDDEREEAKIWEVRESGLAATAHVPGHHEMHPGW
jgi:FAD/FMN-containing dehydrogenase